MEHVEPVSAKSELTEALYHKMVERLESNFPAKQEMVRYIQMW